MKTITELDQEILKNPNDAMLYIERARAYLKEEDDKKAILDYTKALDIDHDNLEAYSGRGTAYSFLEQYDQAIADYSQIIKRDPNNAKAFYNRGCCLSRKGENVQAISDFNLAIKNDQNYAMAYFERGMAFFEIDNDDQAIKDYEKALQKNLDERLRETAKGMLETAEKRKLAKQNIKDLTPGVLDSIKKMESSSNPGSDINEQNPVYEKKSANKKKNFLITVILCGIAGILVSLIIYYYDGIRIITPLIPLILAVGGVIIGGKLSHDLKGNILGGVIGAIIGAFFTVLPSYLPYEGFIIWGAIIGMIAGLIIAKLRKKRV